MNNLLFMQMLDAHDNFLADFGCIFLRIMNQFDNAIEKFPTSNQLKNQEIFCFSLIKIKELYNLKESKSENTQRHSFNLTCGWLTRFKISISISMISFFLAFSGSLVMILTANFSPVTFFVANFTSENVPLNRRNFQLNSVVQINKIILTILIRLPSHNHL